MQAALAAAKAESKAAKDALAADFNRVMAVYKELENKEDGNEDEGGFFNVRADAQASCACCTQAA